MLILLCPRNSKHDGFIVADQHLSLSLMLLWMDWSTMECNEGNIAYQLGILHSCLLILEGWPKPALNRERTAVVHLLSQSCHFSCSSALPAPGNLYRPINSSLKCPCDAYFFTSDKYAVYLSRPGYMAAAALKEFFPGCKNHNLLRKDTN